MANVSVIYHHYPHYRRPVVTELYHSGQHSYKFWGSHDVVNGIEVFPGDDTVIINPLSFKTKGKRWILTGYWPAILDRSVDVVIILGNPNMLATWKMALMARMTGRKVLFWAHGWLKREPFVKRMMRNIYFRMANKILVYGVRAKEIGAESGYPCERISVIYNSLDFDKSQKILARICNSKTFTNAPQRLFLLPSLPLVICTARITSACRFDLLFEAARMLSQKGKPVNILLVGDGPERLGLEDMAKQLKINVYFFGACYDEDVLAELIHGADLTVSPGKVGLTAIHSLSYGTPVITHDNLDEQMPEVEAIIPGVSGELFRYGDAADLANSINSWLATDHDRKVVREECIKIVASTWNPAMQRKLIDQAVSEVLGERVQ
ncbi:glycosyltransferase [Neorhizobium sp. NCHU2750]|uniref:glycosyltransferase n=1 Tax=Neorhizobium sp. NCHU2750 TaxID=1825976 RepID=UPI000E76F9B6